MKLNRSIITIAVVLCILLLWSALHLSLHAKVVAQPYAIAHRGGAGLAPENTLAAVSESIALGIEIIEVDLQRTSDDILILIHDRKIDRTTDGSGDIGELTWKEVSQLDAGSHFSERFAAEGIPTLSSILEVAIDNDIALFLEMKNPSVYPGIEKQIQNAINKYQAKEYVTILSFDHEWLEMFQGLSPDIQTGLICYWKGNMTGVSPANYIGVYWLSVIVDPTLIPRAHNEGLDVYVWTVNSPLLMKIMHWLGVDGMATDRPDIWLEVFNLS
jgi:glycerophosphoryl diester phosphodiesterase